MTDEVMYMMQGCNKCMNFCGWLFLIFGVIFLLQDLGVWMFWGIRWWTVLFLLVGVGGIGQASCKDCQAVLRGKKR